MALLGMMRGLRHSGLDRLVRVLAFLATILILKVTAQILWNYDRYFAVDFTTDFLHGREDHFRGAYRCAFFAHLLSGPFALVMGLVLVSERVRSRFPLWHRRLGWVQVGCVVLLVSPSGLVMASHAAAGPVAMVGLGLLAIATAGCALMGLRCAIRRRFGDHRRWMWRCYLLLASAVVLRMIGGFVAVTGLYALWVDPLATWVCWLGPLAAFEAREWIIAPRPRLTRS